MQIKKETNVKKKRRRTIYKPLEIGISSFVVYRSQVFKVTKLVIKSFLEVFSTNISSLLLR